MPGTSPPHSFDKRQFEQLFKAHFQPLCHFARQYVQDIDTAQDICQRVFIRLWEKREDMDLKRSVNAYLFTAVKNRCLNYIRDHKKYRSQLLDVECGDFDIGITEDYFALEELQKSIDAALSTLPPKCRQVFEMSRYRNMKYKDIAEELDISQKTVEAHMTKAMKSLRAELGEYLVVLMLILCNADFQWAPLMPTSSKEIVMPASSRYRKSDFQSAKKYAHHVDKKST